MHAGPAAAHHCCSAAVDQQDRQTDGHRTVTRHVNSREIAFPGRESQVPGLDRDSRFRPSMYFCLRDRSWIAGGGAKGAGNHRLDPAPFPDDDGTHRRRTWPNNRPTLRAVGTFDVCSNAAVNSDLSRFLYTP